MNDEARAFILMQLRKHDFLTLATLRPDGWPQATTVSYVSDGLTIYVATWVKSQKVHNIRHSAKVSLTIDGPNEDWQRIQGLSMAALAEEVTDPAERSKAFALMRARFKQLEAMPTLNLDTIDVLRITPKVISMLDYTKGFGHTETITM